MKLRDKSLIAVVVAFLAAAFSSWGALAATQFRDSVSGNEIYATSTEGIVAGFASGDLSGYWYADVLHTPLSGQTPSIDGGTFDLSTDLHNQATLITGLFTGGSIAQEGGFTGCSNQTYAVDGLLGDVGIYGKLDHGSGNFVAILTHYRYSLGGYCVIYAASISGSVFLDF